MKPKNLPNWSTLEHNVLSLQASDLCVICVQTLRRKSLQLMHLLHNFLSISMSLNATFFILLDGEIYVILTQANDLFSSSNSVPNLLSIPWTIWKSLYASDQCPLKKKMPFNWCVHSSFWPTMYMFKTLLSNNLSIHFSHIFPRVRSWWFFPREVCEILYMPLLAREMCVAASAQARMCSDCGNLFITWFCLLPYSALSERNE